MAVAANLAGQTGAEKDLQKDLTSKLTELQHVNQDSAKRSDDLTQVLLAVPEAGHRPSRAAVGPLARHLTTALAGRALPAPVANDLATSLIGVFRSAGMGTSEYKALVARFDQALSRAGVSAGAAQTVSSSLADVGKEVRGPQDTPLLPLR
jgi:hypothetical protein